MEDQNQISEFYNTLLMVKDEPEWAASRIIEGKKAVKKLEEIAEKRPYGKYEFCEAIKCTGLIPDSPEHQTYKRCMFKRDNNCCHTAKEYHGWLKENNFRIVKQGEV